MQFRKYMHIERYGTDDVKGINLGNVFIFPKLDGTNASVWIDDDGKVAAGSRNRTLSLEKDNQGFYKWMKDKKNPKQYDIRNLLLHYPNLRLYGEFLVPHTLKTYQNDAWKRFYVFDIYDESDEKYIPYNIYKDILDEYEVDYVPPLAQIQNGEYDDFVNWLTKNDYLIKDGEGIGEGVVLKNYEFENKYDRVVWAKIKTARFKQKHNRTMGKPEQQKPMIEKKIAEEMLTCEFVEKEFAKIRNNYDGWRSQYIPELLGRIFHEFVVEEIWNMIKDYKRPTIDFSILKHFVVSKIKECKKELF